jgi:hypothetical protein
LVRFSICILLAMSCSHIARADQVAARDPRIVVEGEVPKEARKVCRKEMVTGSMLERRVCQTAAQREDERRDSQATLEDMRRQADTQEFVRNTGNKR